jgi:hypothetical protein
MKCNFNYSIFKKGEIVIKRNRILQFSTVGFLVSVSMAIAGDLGNCKLADQKPGEFFSHEKVPVAEVFEGVRYNGDRTPGGASGRYLPDGAREEYDFKNNLNKDVGFLSARFDYFQSNRNQLSEACQNKFQRQYMEERKKRAADLREEFRNNHCETAENISGLNRPLTDVEHLCFQIDSELNRLNMEFNAKGNPVMVIGPFPYGSSAPIIPNNAEKTVGGNKELGSESEESAVPESPSTDD